MTRLINHNSPVVRIPRGYLTLSEIAARMKCSYNRVRDIVKRGELKAGNLPRSKRILIRVEAFERYCRWQGEARREWRLDE